MTNPQMIPDSAEREVDWSLDPDTAAELDAPSAETQHLLRDVHRKFGRNVAATILARFVNMARGVCIVPFLLAHIGLEAYGIWTTIFILVTYVGISTMGISNVYIKYVAEFHARKEYDKANALLSTGLAVTIPLCGAIFAAFWLGWNLIVPLLHLPPAHAAEGKEAVLIVLAVFLSSIALSAFTDLLTGMQQIAVNQFFLTLGILGECAAIVWLVLAGRGIRGLAEAYLIRTILNDGLSIWWACRQIKWLRISPSLVRRESLKYVVHFGGLVQFQGMLSIFLNSVDRVAALCLIDASAAGLLDVAKKWPVSFSSVPMAFFGAMLPAASHVDAASDGQDRLRNLRQFYLTGARYSNLCTSAFSAAMIFWAAPILRVWLGPALPMKDTLVPLFVVFCFALQFHMLTGPGTSVLRGIGKVYEEFTYSIPNLVLLAIALPVSFWIEKGWTPFGIGVAVSLATVGSACVLMGRVLWVLDLPLGRFLRVVIVPGLAPYLIAGLLAWPAARFVAQVNRWQGMGVLVVVGLVYMAGLLAILDRWVLTSDEKQKSYALLNGALAVFQG